jgi:hypothetical protein
MNILVIKMIKRLDIRASHRIKIKRIVEIMVIESPSEDIIFHEIIISG